MDMQSAAQNISAIRLLDESLESLRNKIEQYHQNLMKPEIVARRLMADYCGIRIPHEGIVNKVASRVQQALENDCSITAPVSCSTLATASSQNHIPLTNSKIVRFFHSGQEWVMLKDIGRIAGYSDDGSKLLESLAQTKILETKKDMLYFRRNELDENVLKQIPKHSPGFFAITVPSLWKIATYYKRLGLTDAMKEAIGKVFPEIYQTGNYIGNSEKLSTEILPEFNQLKSVLNSQQIAIDSMKEHLEAEIEQQRKQYRVLLALIPKITDNVQKLVHDTKSEMENGIIAMLVNFKDKMDTITQMSQQKMYTATEIAHILNVAPSTVGRVAKNLGYRGNPNYSFVTLSCSKGRTFPKEQIFYKEVAILGIRSFIEQQKNRTKNG